MRKFLAAISMLSILPVGRFVPRENDLHGMVNYYPAAGLLFAALFYPLGILLQYCPLYLGAVLLTLAPEVLTKGFHLDGLADTADGFLSGRPRERKLEIMHDSHIGTMGVAAIFAVFALKSAAFASMTATMLPMALTLMMLSGRCAIVWHIAFSRYARPQGLGQLSFGVKPYAGLICAILFPAVAGWYFYGNIGWILAPGIFVFMLGWSALTRHVIGGATGDTIGCGEELTETAVVCLLALHS